MMVFSLGRILGRRLFPRIRKALIDRYVFTLRGLLIGAAIGGIVGSYAYNSWPAAEEDRTETAGEARRRQEAEARAKRFEELKAEFKAMNIDIEKILPIDRS